MTLNMTISDHGLDLTTQWEGKRAQMYLDSAGNPSIGVGHLLTKGEKDIGQINIAGEIVNWNSGLSDMQIEDLLRQDMYSAQCTVNRVITEDVNQNQFDALCDLCFNIGGGAFADSHVVIYINSGQMDLVPDAFRMWNRAGGQVIQGLVNRRENEVKLWLGEI
jgi:lysozyme